MPHFEIHVQDVDAAKAFYGGLFGWKFEPMPGVEEIDYQLIQGEGIGGDSDLTGGLLPRTDQSPEPGSPIRGGTMTFEVSDCNARYDWALAHGGAEALPPTDYPGIGRCAYVEDGQGNVVGMIAPAREEN
ncbi:VOC family protein [Sedimentitalea sp.]|uniref:VOC family protein n=1 Tax=Sedimentitalea sp. TaxID=2048915 RepID=UPI003298ADB4